MTAGKRSESRAIARRDQYAVRRTGDPNQLTEREADALHLYARGGWTAVYEELNLQPGGTRSRREKEARQLVEEALLKKTNLPKRTVDAARRQYLDWLEAGIDALGPRAIGYGVDSDGNPRSPDPKAYDLWLKSLDRWAAAQGVNGPPKETNLNIRIEGPEDPEQAKQRILADLARVHQQQTVIEGHLAGAGTTLGEIEGGRHSEDRPGPPPREDP